MAGKEAGVVAAHLSFVDPTGHSSRQNPQTRPPFYSFMCHLKPCVCVRIKQQAAPSICHQPPPFALPCRACPGAHQLLCKCVRMRMRRMRQRIRQHIGVRVVRVAARGQAGSSQRERGKTEKVERQRSLSDRGGWATEAQGVTRMSHREARGP